MSSGTWIDDITPHQRDVRKRAIRAASEWVAPVADAVDAGSAEIGPQLSRLTEVGLMSVTVPTEWGGLGAGATGYSLAVTELARACASTTVAVMVTNMVAEAIARFGTREQKERYLPEIVSGRFRTASFCLSEPDSGSDAAAMRTRAVRVEGGWSIEGTKAWITSAPSSGVLFTWAKSDAAAGARGISAFLIEPGDGAVSFGAPEEKMGQHGSATTTVRFDGVRVPGDRLIGGEGGGFRIAMTALDGGRIGVASQALGIGLAAVEGVTRLLLEEGRLDDDASGKIGRQRAALEAARALVLRAAWLKDRGDGKFTRQASMAKLYASEAAWESCETAVLLAGSGDDDERRRLARYLGDVRVTRIYEGTSEIQRLVITREMMREFGSGAGA